MLLYQHTKIQLQIIRLPSQTVEVILFHIHILNIWIIPMAGTGC